MSNPGPLLTLAVQEEIRGALRAGQPQAQVSLDLGRTTTTVAVSESGWAWDGRFFPFIERCKDRTLYHWSDADWQPAARYSGSLVKLVPTEWGPPTFEIDGIKMLPTAKVSPYTDAVNKVALVAPRGKTVLDTCGGLGYFAAACLQGGAARILSFEKNPDVLWLRTLNPWSPLSGGVLQLEAADVTEEIAGLPAASVDAILHDPPRFGIAGELYSQAFYDQLARVLKKGGGCFTTPERRTG